MTENWKTVVSFLDDLVSELDPNRPPAERAGIYGGASALFSALRTTVQDDYGADGYALEKIGKARWAFAAALGIDDGNELGADHHRMLARGALMSLQNHLNWIDTQRGD